MDIDMDVDMKKIFLFLQIYLIDHTLAELKPVLLGLTGPYWALLGFTGPYWALLGCITRPYWALLGLTGPYWALIGLTLHLSTN